MTQKKTTRSSPATTTTTTTSVTNAQLKAMINQGVADALVALEADRSQNGKDCHDSGMGNGNCVPYKQLHCENQIKFSTCTLLGSALTWWNSHIKTVGPDVAYAMTWTNLKKKMTDKYCPRGEIKKSEVELWNLKVKGTDVDAIEFATELMNKKSAFLLNVRLRIKRSKMITNNKKTRGKTLAGPGEKKPYGGSKPLYYKCNYHHDGPCAPKCHKCNRVRHLARDCRNSAATNNQRNLTCYECGNQGHYRSDCPELKNQNHGNQAEGTGAHGMVHALGGG
nr:hypothetical protein [Tanacetum cinerariifolium]